MLYSGRTDMAAEAHGLSAAQTDAAGLRTAEETLGGFPVTTVEVLDARGAAALGKPIGKYYTLLLPERFGRGSESFAGCVTALSELIRRCLPTPCERVLAAALGNPDITPDALGGLAAGSILVTRHLKGAEPETFSGFCSLALCRPGVLGTSGIESAEQVSLLCRELRPELVLVIDALAGADAERLCRTVQVTDTGLAPGSGVGNDRRELSAASLGVPVVAVGMPTVIDAAALCGGAEGLEGLFVTPRGIDSLVRQGARVIGYAVDLALHRGISLDDIDLLLG